MKKSDLKVVLNMARLPVPQLIIQTRRVVSNVDANATIFVDANPLTVELTASINALSDAFNATANKGMSETTAMHDQKMMVLEQMHDLANFVEKRAGNDASIVHLAGLEIKQYGTKIIPEFKVINGTDHGSVNITVKARKGSKYKWQYCIDPSVAGSWIDAAVNGVHKVTISGLTPGINWFRVIFIDNDGEHVQEAVRFAVN